MCCETTNPRRANIRYSPPNRNTDLTTDQFRTQISFVDVRIDESNSLSKQTIAPALPLTYLNDWAQ